MCKTHLSATLVLNQALFESKTKKKKLLNLQLKGFYIKETAKLRNPKTLERADILEENANLRKEVFKITQTLSFLSNSCALLQPYVIVSIYIYFILSCF